MRGRQTAASRAKAATLKTLKRDLGKEKIGHLDRQKLIDYGKMRADQGAGPVTLSIDIGVIKMIITHAAAVHGLDISPEPVDLARVALKWLGLIGKGTERDRRPTTDELNRLFRCFDDNGRLTLPMTRIVKFAVATAMRLDEICRVAWTDLDVDRRMLMIRDRKDPRNKTGNDQRIPLFAATGFDARALVTEQAKELGHARGRIFPYNSKSVGTAFRRACVEVSVKDLHFHDLRHEGTSRLFEAGFAIEQVSLVTGHKDWKMLRRYTHIRAAREKIVARSDEDRQDFLRKRGFSKTETGRIVETVLAEEGRPPESVFDFVQGITAVARSRPQQDARLAMEGKAKALLEIVA